MSRLLVGLVLLGLPGAVLADWTDADIAAMLTKTDTEITKLTSLVTSMASADSRLATANTTLSSLDSRLTTANTTLTAMNTTLTSANSKLTTINTGISNTKAEVQNVSTNLLLALGRAGDWGATQWKPFMAEDNATRGNVGADVFYGESVFVAGGLSVFRESASNAGRSAFLGADGRSAFTDSSGVSYLASLLSAQGTGNTSLASMLTGQGTANGYLSSLVAGQTSGNSSLTGIASAIGSGNTTLGQLYGSAVSADQKLASILTSLGTLNTSVGALTEGAGASVAALTVMEGLGASLENIDAATGGMALDVAAVRAGLVDYNGESALLESSTGGSVFSWREDPSMPSYSVFKTYEGGSVFVNAGGQSYFGTMLDRMTGAGGRSVFRDGVNGDSAFLDEAGHSWLRMLRAGSGSVFDTAGTSFRNAAGVPYLSFLERAGHSVFETGGGASVFVDSAGDTYGELTVGRLDHLIQHFGILSDAVLGATGTGGGGGGIYDAASYEQLVQINDKIAVAETEFDGTALGSGGVDDPIPPAYTGGAGGAIDNTEAKGQFAAVKADAKWKLTGVRSELPDNSAAPEWKVPVFLGNILGGVGVNQDFVLDWSFYAGTPRTMVHAVLIAFFGWRCAMMVLSEFRKGGGIA